MHNSILILGRNCLKNVKSLGKCENILNAYKIPTIYPIKKAAKEG